MKMKKNLAKHKMIFLAIMIFSLASACFLCNAEVYAATIYNWATGGYNANVSGTSGKTHFDCYSATRCPRWIKVPKSVYQSILNSGNERVVGSYGALPDCANDPDVVIAGNQNQDGYVQIYNLTSPTVNPTKISKTYASVASSDTSVVTRNFFGEENSSGVTDDNGRIMTYNEILNEVIKASGKSEKNLAVFCASMVEDTKEYYSESNVSIGDGSVFAMTKTRGEQYTTDPYAMAEINGQEAIITFSHNVYTKTEASNVSWYITKDGLENNNSYSIEEVTSGSGIGNGPSPVDFNNRVGTTVGYLYTASDSNRPGYNGGRNYISRSQYKITFKEDGEYTFCQGIGFSNGVYLTKACAKLKVGVKFYAKSNISDSVSQNTTGITTGEMKTVWLSDKNVVLDSMNGMGQEPEYLTFSHDAYASEPVENISWKVGQEFDSKALGYTISRIYYGVGDNPTNLSEADGAYYTDTNKMGYDTYGFHLIAEGYAITFKNAGTYTFCETMSVNNDSPYTRVCAKYIVSKTSTPSGIIVTDACKQWESEYLIMGTTNVLSKIINPRIKNGNYTGWQDHTYARPDDNVEWRNCYFPGAQYYATALLAELPAKFGADGYEAVDVEGVCYNSYINKKWFMNILGDAWTSKIMLKTYNKSSPYGLNDLSGKPAVGKDRYEKTYSYTKGDTATKSVGSNLKINRTTDLAQTYNEEIRTVGGPTWTYVDTSNYHSWSAYCCISGCGCSCCKECCCPTYSWVTHVHKNNPWTIGNYNNNEKKDDSQVTIPYNFINSASFEISTNNELDVVYAGGTISVTNSTVEVNKRTNYVVDDSYTTRVDDAEVRLVAYVSDKPASQQLGEQYPTDYSASTTDICNKGWLDEKQCMEVKKYNGGTTRLNPSGALYGYTHNDLDFVKSYNVFDASAGDYMCFVMAVFPWRSGPVGNDYADKITEKAGTESKWLITAPKCKIIAKKPSMQVTGGSVYTNGNITTSVSAKRNLYGLTNYAPFNPIQAYFGSWAEEAVVANGEVRRFASGAALGKNDKNLAGYGASSSNFCTGWIPLSFANYTLNNFYSGLCNSVSGNPDTNFSGGANIAPTYVTKNRAALVDYFATGSGVQNNSAYFSINDTWLGERIPSGTGKDIWYYNIAGTANIDGGTIGNNSTRVIKASGEVNINRNIEYNTASMTSMNEVPKVVIYSSSNIHIACGVSRVDAILIAEGTVYSCDSYTTTGGNINSPARSNSQLVINGVVIANKVEFARTYGNAAGQYSGTPAEVINYDTSSLIWSRSMAGAAESDTLTTVYTRELSPRY